MEKKILLSGVSGSGNSESYGIFPKDDQPTEVQVFLTFSGGSVSLEASADGTNFAPIRDGQFNVSEVVAVDLAEGSYLRIAHTGISSNLTAIVQPKVGSNA